VRGNSDGQFRGLSLGAGSFRFANKGALWSAGRGFLLVANSNHEVLSCFFVVESVREGKEVAVDFLYQDQGIRQSFAGASVLRRWRSRRDAHSAGGWGTTSREPLFRG